MHQYGASFCGGAAHTATSDQQPLQPSGASRRTRASCAALPTVRRPTTLAPRACLAEQQGRRPHVCRCLRPTLTHRLGGRLHQRRGGTPTRALVPKKIRHVRPGNRRWSRGGCLAARQRVGPPCPILHLAGDSHARCSPAARHRLDIRDELGNGTAGGRWEPRLPGQPASPLDPHTLVWTALANSIADRRGLRVRDADKHPQANTPRPQVRTVHQSAALGPNTSLVPPSPELVPQRSRWV